MLGGDMLMEPLAAILHKMKARFHLPMVANQFLQVARLNRTGIKTRQEIANIVRFPQDATAENLTIHSPASGNPASLTHMIGGDLPTRHRRYRTDEAGLLVFIQRIEHRKQQPEASAPG